MSNNKNERSSRFSSLLSKYLEDCREHNSEANEGEIWEMVENGEVSSIEVSKVVRQLLANASSNVDKLQLVIFMKGLLNLDFTFPEFFWIIIKENLLFISSNVSDIGNISGLLAACGTSEMVRSYLISSLLIEDENKWRQIINAFYPVGYTISALKKVRQILTEPNPSNLDLYQLVYQGVKWSISEVKDFHSISNDDRDYLSNFFLLGLSLGSESITGICKEALIML